MAGITGKGALSFKKQSVKESLLPALGFKKTVFMHEATAGQTQIDLGSLTTPAEAVANGFVQPNLSDLLATSLLEWKENLVLKSSLYGDLQQFLAYKVLGASRIKLLYAAEEGEIITGVIDPNPRTGLTIVDAQPIVSTGTLLAGAVDFNVGQAFQVGMNPSAQHGALMIMVDGQLVYRNTGNQPAGPGVVGDYQEVHAGEGLGLIIRFNASDVVDRNISALSIGALAERPNAAQLALVESLAGQVDRMVATLAAVAGIPETDLQTLGPNNVDLKAFGDRVLAMEAAMQAPGAVRGMAYVERSDTTQFTTAVGIPSDDTIPQSNEGELLLTVSYTPRKAGNTLLIEAQLFGSEDPSSNFSDELVAAVFIGSDADAVAAAGVFASNPTDAQQSTDGVYLQKKVVAPGGPMTFHLRGALNGLAQVWNLNTLYTNGTGDIYNLGGRFTTWLKVTEIEA